MKTTDNDLLFWLSELRDMYFAGEIKKPGLIPNDLTSAAKYMLSLIGYRTTDIFAGSVLPRVFACGENVIPRPQAASLEDIEQLFEYFEISLQIEDTVPV